MYVSTRVFFCWFSSFLLFIYLFLPQAFARSAPQRDQIIYTGQDRTPLDLAMSYGASRPVEETYTAQCNRDYTDGFREECRNVTRYRQECETIPGREECRDVQREECENRERVRRECRHVPAHRQCTPSSGTDRVCEPGERLRVCEDQPPVRECRPTPPRCRIINGERVCEDRGDSEDCVNRPIVPVCREVVGPGRCREVPRPENCRVVPSREDCRDVIETERVCRDVVRRECQWIEARESCRRIPYEERQCENVPNIVTIEYPCERTRIVQRNVTIQSTARLMVNFRNELEADHRLTLDFLLLRDMGLNINLLEGQGPGSIVLLQRRWAQRREQNSETISGTLNVFLLDAKIYASLSTSSLEGEVEFKGGTLYIPLPRIEAADQLNISLRLQRRFFGFRRTRFEDSLRTGEVAFEHKEGKTMLKVGTSRFAEYLSAGRNHFFTLEFELPSHLEAMTPLSKSERVRQVRFSSKLQ